MAEKDFHISKKYNFRHALSSNFLAKGKNQRCKQQKRAPVVFKDAGKAGEILSMRSKIHRIVLRASSGGAVILFTLLLAAACGDRGDCRLPQGRYSNREGQALIFMPNGQGLWLTQFGSMYDTTALRYRTDCSTAPTQIDMNHFQGAMYEGRQLYGLLEWSSDSSFRFIYEIGDSPTVRPSTFESELTQQFYAEE
jgi:hypothetical protein